MIKFQSFQLDRENQCLWHGETRAAITPKAFDVLRYLVERAGRLVTPDELLAALWPETYINPEGLRRYIQEIRKVLRDRIDEPVFIETLPKRGYRFVASIVDEVAAGTLAAKATTSIVGRGPESVTLEAYLTKAKRAERQVVFITGEPGIGKTALVDEFQRQVRVNTPEVRVARGQCVEGYGGKEPYYPMLEAVSQLCGGPGGDKVVQILSAQAPTWLVQFPALVKREQRESLQREILGATRERMLREICEGLETIASERPLLLVLEDMHWVDHFTVDLISALARRRQSAKLMLIGTFRPVDVALSDHPLKAVKRDLLIHHLCQEIALQPLNEAAVAEYLGAESGGAGAPEGLTELIYRHSEGNPLFMVAALEHMRAQKLITKENDKLILTVPLKQIELRAPESLRQMIENQIERLDKVERRTLEVASIAGVLFSTVICASAAEMDVEEFEELCHGLSLRHKIVRLAQPQEFPGGVTSGRYEFAHALYREELYHRQSPARRAKLHQSIGEGLVRAFSRHENDVAAELAEHFEKASDWRNAIKYLCAAADSVLRRYAHTDASEILQHALELSAKIPETERAETETRILEKLARTYVASADSRTIATFESLIARAARSGLIEVQFRALIDVAVMLSLSNTQHAMEVLEQARRLGDLQIPSKRTGAGLSCAVWRIIFAGWNAEDMELCRTAIAAIRQSGDRRALALHLVEYSSVQLNSAEYRQAYRSAVEGLDIFLEVDRESLNLGPISFMTRSVIPLSLLFAGECGEALLEVDASIAMTEKNGHPYRRRLYFLYRALVHLEVMDFEGALAVCAEVMGSIESDSNPSRKHHTIICLTIKGMAEMGLGKYDRAFESLTTAADDLDGGMIMRGWYWQLFIGWGLTSIWLTRGDRSKARREAELLLKGALSTAERTWQGLAWEASARVDMAEGDLARAKECIAKALSAMEGFEVPMAEWRVHATASALYARLGEDDSAEKHRHLSCATIMTLANSLPIEGPLRNIFLSAPIVRKILGKRR